MQVRGFWSMSVNSDNDLIINALMQYQRGKWAGTPREKIPLVVIAAALAAYDPAQKLKFNGRKRDSEVRFMAMQPDVEEKL